MAPRTQCGERERAQAVRQHREGERIASWAAWPAASGGRCVVHRHEVLNGSLNSLGDPVDLPVASRKDAMPPNVPPTRHLAKRD